MKIPKKVIDRLPQSLKHFSKVAEDQKLRDVAEADTVTLVKDIMADCFGYHKYLELTSEQQIRGTFCDLAVKIDNKIKYLVEVKAAGIDLNESHIRQAVNYGANEGIEWIVLTNSIDWRLYRLKFTQPIDFEEVTAFSITNLNLRNQDDLAKVFLLCKEGISSDAMDTFHQTAQILNKYTIAQVVQSEAVTGIVRREFRRLFPEIKIDLPEISELLQEEVLKREVVDGEKATEAASKVKKAYKRVARELAKKKASE